MFFLKQQKSIILLFLLSVLFSEQCHAQKKFCFGFNYEYHNFTNHVDNAIKSGSGFSALLGVYTTQQVFFEFEYIRSFWGSSKELFWNHHFFSGKGLNLKIYLTKQRKFLTPFITFGAGFGSLNWENEKTIFVEQVGIKDDKLQSLFFHPNLGIEIMIGEKSFFKICGRILFNHWENYSEKRTLPYFQYDSFGHIVMISLGITHFI